MGEATLSADTQAALLLCASLGQKAEGPDKPLAPKEYGELIRILELQAIGPGDLLDSSKLEQARRSQNGEVDWSRVGSLLERGSGLAFAVESWAAKGIWVLGQRDDGYPERLSKRLKYLAPPVLFGVGDRQLLKGGGMAIVGSRDVDETSAKFSRELGSHCARQGIQVISGAARGVDSEAMAGALDGGGRVVGVLAEQLVRAAVSPHLRTAIEEDALLLVTPYDPHATFLVGRAMGRNKYLYALSDVAVVVCSAAESGGTWAGAIENLKHQWVPLFVRADHEVPEGNRRLLAKGGLPLDSEYLAKSGDLRTLIPTYAEFEPHTNRRAAPVISEHRPPSQGADLKTTALTSGADSFDNAWPELATLLSEERSEKELRKALNVTRKQLGSWLAHAVELGRIEKLLHPVRYVLKQEREERGQGNLF
jgi:predicted Rossmann fold nucleotide-binding protein DprA/Smf involved in DNA uptake